MGNSSCASWRLSYAVWLSTLTAHDVLSLPLGWIRLARLSGIHAWPQESMATQLRILENTMLFYVQPLADAVVSCIMAPIGFILLVAQLHSIGEDDCLGLEDKSDHTVTIVVPCLCLTLALGCMGAGVHCCGVLERSEEVHVVVEAQPAAVLPLRARARLCMAPFAAPNGEVFMCGICLVETSEDIDLRWGKLPCSHCYHKECIDVSVVSAAAPNGCTCVARATVRCHARVSVIGPRPESPAPAPSTATQAWFQSGQPQAFTCPTCRASIADEASDEESDADSEEEAAVVEVEATGEASEMRLAAMV